MICKKCKATYPDDKPICPYCGQINDEKLAQDNMLAASYDGISPVSPAVKKQKGLTAERLVIGSFIAFILMTIFLKGLDYYYDNRDDWAKEKEISSEKHDANVQLINSYLDNKQYRRALTLASATDPDYEFKNYLSLKEELDMINDYYRFIDTPVSLIENDGDTEYLYASSSDLQDYKSLYDAVTTTERAASIKEELCSNADLYLKYYYRLTDDEIKQLREIKDFYDFELNGTTDFDDLLEERMKAYEKNN